MTLAEVKKGERMPSNVGRAEKTFTEHGDFIRSIIRFNVKDDTLLEDIFQDFFLFLISNPVPTDVRNTKGFLYRLLSDRIKDTFRRIDRYRLRVRRYAHRRPPISEYRPEEILIEIEESKKLFRLIEKNLPPTESRAVTLRYRSNYNTRIVAEKLGVKPRSVSRYVSVGLKKIRHTFSEDRGYKL